MVKKVSVMAEIKTKSKESFITIPSPNMTDNTCFHVSCVCGKKQTIFCPLCRLYYCGDCKWKEDLSYWKEGGYQFHPNDGVVGLPIIFESEYKVEGGVKRKPPYQSNIRENATPKKLIFMDNNGNPIEEQSFYLDEDF